jgi:hypothetical protein
MSNADWLPQASSSDETYLREIAIQLGRIADRLEVQFPTEAESRAKMDAARIRINEEKTAKP